MSIRIWYKITPMEVSYATAKLEELCKSLKLATKKHGAACAKRLTQRIEDLSAAPALEEFRRLPGGCHELHGDLRGKLALNLPDGKRLLIEPDHDPTPTRPDGGLDWSSVTAVRIVDIRLDRNGLSVHEVAKALNGGV